MNGLTDEQAAVVLMGLFLVGMLLAAYGGSLLGWWEK